MKTTFYLIAILVLIIPGMLKGQAPTNKGVDGKSQSGLIPTTKVSYDTKKENKRGISKEQISATSSEKAPEVNEKINMIDKQIAELLKLRSGLAEETNSSYTANASKFNNSNETQNFLLIQMDQFFALQDEAEELNKKYVSLKQKAVLEKESDRVKLMKEANEIYKVYEVKQIETSNTLAQINYVKFRENKTTINTMLIDYKGGAIMVKLVNKLSDEADFAMHMAIEIREEANAQPNNSAKLGNYSNAEEKEVIALNKQDEAIDVLEKTAYFKFLDLSNGLALNLKR